MELTRQTESGKIVTCLPCVIGVIPAMMTEGNPHPVICPYSFNGLTEEFIRDNLPEGARYDPNFDCGVTTCHYRE